MRLDRLNVFLDAAQTLNFSETAQRLHISQSTVSKHIGDLERQLNVILFERANGRLRLSEAGRALIPWTRQLMREVERFQAVAQSLPGDVAGPLRIACTTAAGKYVLPRLAVRFRERFPNVQISMLGCRPMEVEDFLRDTKADLAVVSAEATDPALECQHFFTDQVILIVPSGHAWALRQRVEPDELVGEPLLLREPTSGTRRVLQSALAARDIALTDLNVALELGNAEAIVAAVAAGVGVAFVSQLSAAFALEAGRVRRVEVNGFDLRRAICVWRRSSIPPSRPAELFWGFIHEPENKDLLNL